MASSQFYYGMAADMKHTYTYTYKPQQFTQYMWADNTTEASRKQTHVEP